ncbi:MAG: hypothetical protein ACO3EY_05820 [Candidatus Nanopelagicales bacterium]
MANPRIEVEIGAVIDGLRKGFGESVGIIGALEKQALDLDKALRAATTVPEIANLNAKLAQTKSAISQLKSTGIEPLTKATSQFNVVGLDFARVIQDAPFGIIGVGNNITQLAQSFSTLGKAGDSLSSKFKLALGQIFSSSNALILGVSILTTALTYLTQKGFFDSEKGAKSLTDRLKEYEETLGSVARATLKGIQNSEGELQKFKALTAQAQNLNVSDKNRLAAVNELQKQYPEYLGNLTKEQILTGQVGDSYDILTKQIIANAKAKAFSDEITKNSSDLRTLEKEQNDTANQILAKRIELQNAQARSNESGLKVSGQLAATDLTVLNITGELNDLIQKQTQSISEANKIKQSNLELDGLINQELQNGAVFTNKNTDARNQNTKALDEWKKKAEEIQRVLDTEAFLESREIKFDLNVEKFNKQIQDAFAPEKEIKVKIKTDVVLDEDIPDELPFIDRLLERLNPKKFTELEERTAQFATTMLGILDNGLANAFVDLGQSIGEALATGGNVLSAVGKSLLGSVGKLLGDFGKQLIAFGVAGLSYSKLIKALFTNPATAAPKAGLAIAAGVALVALSGAISSGLRSNSGGGGGDGGGGGVASVGSSGVGGGTSFAGGGQGGLFQQNRDLNGELVVRGQDLVYVFSQANNKINKG